MRKLSCHYRPTAATHAAHRVVVKRLEKQIGGSACERCKKAGKERRVVWSVESSVMANAFTTD